jgi:hypothetical protein
MHEQRRHAEEQKRGVQVCTSSEDTQKIRRGACSDGVQQLVQKSRRGACIIEACRTEECARIRAEEVCIIEACRTEECARIRAEGGRA